MNKPLEEIDNAAEYDVRSFWRLISQHKPRKISKSSRMSYKGKVIESPTAPTDIFAMYYSELYTPVDDINQDRAFKTVVDQMINNILDLLANFHSEIPGVFFTSNELDTAIFKLKIRKAPGLELTTSIVRFPNTQQQEFQSNLSSITASFN